MAYCSKCGRKIADDAKFCDGCGSPVSSRTYEKDTTRKQEYAGSVRKCPACGEEIPSFTAICPSCGHEINSSHVSSSIIEFSEHIKQADIAIANSPLEPKTGWKSWSSGKKCGWVILNVFTMFIPLMLYFLIPLLGIGKMANLTAEEKKKVSIIQNYAFPNDRENILEALLFIKSQVSTLAAQTINRNTLRWVSIWKAKATELFQKAELMFRNDKIANDAYNDIISNEKKVKKNIAIKFGIVAIIVVVALIFLLTRSNHNNLLSSGAKTSPTISENQETNDDEGIYTYEIRNYIGKNAAAVGEKYGDTLIEEYGNGKVRIVFVTDDGMLLCNDEMRKQYVIVDQNLSAGSRITVIHERNSSGKPYSYLVDYQSYDEIILFASPIGNDSYSPEFSIISPTLDRHCYHIRDYVGRNAASFGSFYGNDRIDEYGAAKLKLVFSAENGAFIDTTDLNILKQYVVISQDVAVNSNLELTYDTNSKGVEYDNLIKSQNINEINLTVRKLSDSIVEKMPVLEEEDSSSVEKMPVLEEEDSSSDDYQELQIKYRVLSNGNAEITGFSGDGNHVTIDSKIDGHKVVSIGDSAFKGCDILESVLFWADVEAIGDYAFSGCTALKDISIPNETKEIGKHAFENCTSLSSIILWGDPDIDDYAFSGCSSLLEISIGNDTKRVGSHAFDGCTSLTSVIVWNDDTVIEKDAFANCPNLKDRPIQE